MRTYLSPIGLAVFLVALGRFAEPAVDAELRVLKMGLGSGTVTSTPAGIACGADCSETYAPAVSVTLTATPDAGSTFLGWDVDPDGDPSTTPDCSGTSPTCSVPSLTAARSVRPTFGLATPIPTISDFTPDGAAGAGGIRRYLNDNPSVTTPARFVAALPAEYRQNWILMSRSESLQPGTSDFPRILLPSPDARFVFTVGMTEHSSYPGAHPNAIEYMQWDPVQKNFRFHEIVVDAIPQKGVIPARSRGISIDDEKCSKCHSTRNVLSLDRSVTPPVPGAVGTDGIPAGTVKAKNKPNWDSYDSWGGMMPFNRDRIYQGSAEAATFRKLLNPWTWSANAEARAIMEQLRLQPPGVTPTHGIRRMRGGANDGHITFAFDGTPPVLTEPAPSSSGTGQEAPISTAYSFDGLAGTGTATSVTRGGGFVLLHHTSDLLGTSVSVEGRGVQLFDLLGGLDGTLNQQRIADEVATHRWATGNFPIDVRPIALAITRGCFTISGNTITSTPALTIDLGFFNTRNGMAISQLVTDTRDRARSMPRRKADMQKRHLDRTDDPYSSSALNGLIQQYGGATSFGTDVSMPRLRREIFRRPNDLGDPDQTVMNSIYVDREDYGFNTSRVALYRYFLEPLGVSVDKWAMGVRGRSRTYAFADVFSTYRDVFIGELEASLGANPAGGLGAPPYFCPQLIPAVNSTLASLPDVNEIPKYTDVQRIFNKSCIECHGGLDYPPYSNHGTVLDLSENETPPSGKDRLDRSHDLVMNNSFTTNDPATSFLYERITGTSEDCPYGLMPCGGPKLSKVDIETIRRWIVGGRPNTRGDPHIETIDGVNYDFQSAGEFVLLRGQNFEIQARQTAVTTAAPLGPNPHTGLSSCVSVNSAVALRVGRHRITYQPNISGRPDPEGLQLRVDSNLVTLSAQGLPLPSGGRLVKTSVPGGIQVEAPGGTVVVITPGWWDHYQLWYLNIDARHARASEGVMGTVAAGNWLPALPDGTLLGPRPRDLHRRYVDLYERFENAWRVSDATTLFDYGPGTSTSTFTIEQWPVENPQNCIVPPQRTGPPPRPPLPVLALPVAEQHCQAVAAGNHRTNCILDVMATGDTGFARTYLRSQEVERNRIPPAPRLVSPEKFQTDLTVPVNFTWKGTTDADGDTPTYRYCVWEVTNRYTFNACQAVDSPAPSWHRGALWSLLIALLFCLLLALLFFLGVRRRALLLSLVLVAIVAVIVAFLIGRAAPGKLSRTVAGLEPGKAYYWKVIAEDGKAGTVESETRRFQIRG